MTTNIRPLTRISPAQIIAGGGQQDSDYVLDRPPFTRYVWNGSDFAMIGAPDATHTAAQLAALAAAGGLTPYATYVASDTGVAGFASDASTLNPGINADGDIESPTGALYALSEALPPYVTLTASGLAFTGPCEVGGWYCSVAAGTIAIYDALSETGTPFVSATTLVAGPMPIMGAGTRGVMRFTTGCYVKLSGAATVRVLVGA